MLKINRKTKIILSVIAVMLALLIPSTPLSMLSALADSTGFSFGQIQLFSDDACTQPLPSSNVGKTDKVVMKFPFSSTSDATLKDYSFEIPKEIPIISAQDIPVNDTEGNLVGTVHLIKSTAGSPTDCTFTLSKAGENGYFVLSSQFNVGDDENTTPVTIVFKADGIALPIDINFVQGAPQISKHHTAFNPSDGSTGTIQWTIDVNTKLNTVKGGVFRDPLPAGMTIVDGSFTVDGNSGITPDISNSNGVQTLAYTFPESSFSNEREVTFKTNVPPAMYNTSIINNAYLDYTGDNNTPASTSDTTTAPVSYINKSGIYDSASKSITWTINFNTSGLNISNAVITDRLPSGLVPSSVKIGASDVTLDSAAVKGSGEYAFNAGTNTLTYYASPTISSVQTLTIVTPVPDSYFQTNSNNYSNSATITADSGVYPLSGVKSNNAIPTVGPSGPSLSSSTLEKTFSSYDPTTGVITWHVVINRNMASLTNTQFSDTIPTDQSYVDNSAKFYDSNFTSPLGTQPGSISYVNNTLSWEPGSISDTYYIWYQTKLNPDVAARNGAYTTKANIATLKNDEITTTKSVNPKLSRGVIQKNAVTYDYVNRTIGWSIDVNNEKMTLSGNTVSADGTNSNSGVVVKDDLSAMASYQFAFVDNSTVTVTSQDNPSTPVNVTRVSSLSSLTAANTYYYDAAAKLLYINLGNLDSATPAAREKIIKFNTPLSSSVDVNSYFAGNWVYNVPNTASLLDDQYIGTEAVSTASQEIDNNVIQKGGKYQTGADYIDWVVKLNQNAIDLGQVSLDDDLSGKPLTLDTSSVRLFRQTLLSSGQFRTGTYNATTNPYSIDMSNEITLPSTSVKYSATDKFFHFTVPEDVSGRPYLLLFRTYIDKNQSGANAQNISNTIQFNGVSTGRTNTGTANNVKFQWGYGAATGHAGSVTLKKTDEKGNPLSGATFDLLDMNGNLIQVSKATGTDGKVTIDQLTYNASYQVKEDTPPANYVRNDTPQTVSVNSTAPAASLTFTDTLKTGTIQLHKIDSSGNSLANASFTLYATGGSPVGNPQTSDSNGLIVFGNIPYGIYTVRETGIPTDYTATGGDITADLSDGNSNVQSNTLDLGTVTNTIKMLNISLTKVGVDGKKLSGAVFTLCQDARGNNPVRINGMPVTATSDDNGLLQFLNIPYGDYYLVETTTPADYAPVTPISVSLHDSNSLISYGVLQLGNVSDPLKLGSITFTKLDDDGNGLAGATFVLKDSKGNTTGNSQISDQNGYISFSNVPYGDGYSITETKAPADFHTLSAPVTGISLHSPKIILQSLTNSRLTGTITFTKVNENAKALSDAEFTLYNSSGNQVGTPQTSDINGKITFLNVPFQDGYTVKETKAPQNYSIHKTFTVNLHADIYDYGNVTDTLLQGNIQVIKTDPNGHPLAGSVFTLYDAYGKTVSQAKSNQYGIAEFANITYGNYSIQETTAPDGYSLDKSMHPICLDANNPAPKLSVVNIKIPPIHNPATGSSQTIPWVGAGILTFTSGCVILSKKLRFKWRKRNL